ncbi:dephospho-CoA kinase [Kingella negevensis]|uniref:dephospho-CoA kinase n=1 Tax=Kingella negevensis TaxID=1522312 RepID=UPI0025429466|nr:dephospho-CoA kinase [Kingella negevensis]WII92424.1 dephospho-CoA kinase [Kingella negevensis]
MIWIGLTGGIGSGKSQVAACFSALNVPIIDADAISRQLTNTPNSSALNAIQQAFGDKAIDVSGCLNRAYIRQLVFTDKTAKQRLEAILHPLIMAEIHFQQSQFQAAYGLIEIPTLIENPHFQTLVSRILVVECNEVFRLQRVMKRNGLSEIEVRNIMANQATDEERLRVADDVIRNESSLKDLQQVVQKMHQFYCSLKNTES